MTEKIESLQDLLNLQRALMDQLAPRLASLKKQRSPDAAVQTVSETIELARDALAKAIKERDAVVKYWDDRIALLRARVDGQTNALKHIKEQVKAATAP